MCNSRPVLRVGQTLLFSTASVDPAKTWDEINLDQAVEVAKAAIENPDILYDEISDQLAAHVDVPAVEVPGSRGSDAQLTFTNGVIVDFANVSFQTGGFQHRVRMCMTVCQHGQRSKIWFRSACEKVWRDGAWDEPVHMTHAELGAFFEEADALSANCLISLRAYYRDLLTDQGAQLCGADVLTVTLENDREFVFRGFDSDNPRLNELFSMLDEGGSFTEWLEENELPPGDFVTSMTLPEIEGRIARLNALRGMDNQVEVLDYVTRAGEAAVFVRDKSHIADANRDLFVGVAFAPDAAVRGERFHNSPVFTIAANMLAGATREYEEEYKTAA